MESLYNVLTNNTNQFISNVFVSVCAFLRTKHLTTGLSLANQQNIWDMQESDNCTTVQLCGWASVRLAQIGSAADARVWSPRSYIDELVAIQSFLSCHLPGPATSDNLTVLLTNAIAITSPNALRARLLHRFVTMPQGADKRTKLSQRQLNNDKDRRVLSAPLSFSVKQYFYIDRPPLTTSAADGLATESYSNLMPLNWVHSEKSKYRLQRYKSTRMRLERLFWTIKLHWSHWLKTQSAMTNTRQTYPATKQSWCEEGQSTADKLADTAQ